MASDSSIMERQTMLFCKLYKQNKGADVGQELLNRLAELFLGNNGTLLRTRLNDYLMKMEASDFTELLEMDPKNLLLVFYYEVTDEGLPKAKKIKLETHPENPNLESLISWLKRKKIRKVEKDNIGQLFRDGSELLKLLQNCIGQPIKRSAIKSDLDCCFSALGSLHFDFGTITTEDIKAGRFRETINFLWKIYDFFEIGGIMPEVPNGKLGLLTWYKMKLNGYENIKIVDFWKSFMDGLAFCAIIHLYHPDLFDYKSLSEESPLHNLKFAFNMAEQKLGVPRFFNEEDFLASSASFEIVVLRYAARLYYALEDPRKVKTLNNESTVCFMCQHHATDMNSLYEHLKGHVFPYHKDERGVDNRILAQYKLEEQKCDQCAEVFPRLLDLYIHKERNHPDVGNPCLYQHCQYETTSTQDLKDHLALHQRYYWCHHCGESVQVKNDQVTHFGGH